MLDGPSVNGFCGSLNPKSLKNIEIWKGESGNTMFFWPRGVSDNFVAILGKIEISISQKIGRLYSDSEAPPPPHG